MTALDLSVVPRDVRAASLGLLLGAPSPPALASVDMHAPHGVLTLAVLGASHAVSATSGPRRLTEQVSCDAVAAGGRPLPSRAEENGYTMTARVRTVDRRELDALAASLRAQGAGRPDWLCAAFPGDERAVTALTGAPTPRGWQWRTWHLYPGSRDRASARAHEVVTTHSRWEPR
ncbi:DUF2617 family protein [Frankia sp. CNm7]|uniref:DUF2617 family protein n=1 Tax=Frankia nepalensis TaxID=1836974 RepID=A0A937R6U4_9ACTN|nr:DUF2617 family protein [Frankia nepalensis]MBL7501793.1 DUF2617 family protein [Frankia nepalensis]MBL7513889.1 DUF2617 family protein [Frankia nepalensis]MBL7523973.1 DUF2617 family protein [Frankia nepalensis]MBL7626361.1 DUF2617 family protein [Frankia nepalensis]